MFSMDRYSLSVSATRVNRKFRNISGSSCTSIELFVARRSNYTGRVLEFRPVERSPLHSESSLHCDRQTYACSRVVPRGHDRYREIVQSLETESKLGNFVHHLDWNNATPQCIIRELHGLRCTGKPNFASLDSILYYDNVVTQHSINNPPTYIYDSINDFFDPSF